MSLLDLNHRNWIRLSLSKPSPTTPPPPTSVNTTMGLELCSISFKFSLVLKLFTCGSRAPRRPPSGTSSTDASRSVATAISMESLTAREAVVVVVEMPSVQVVVMEAVSGPGPRVEMDTNTTDRIPGILLPRR